VGQTVGNLIELKVISIGDEARIPDWETLIRILPYVRRKILLCIEDYHAEVEDIQAFARAIHRQPKISGFGFPGGFTLVNLGPLCSALATLPFLHRFILGLREPQRQGQRDLVNFEPLKELLRAPTLLFVRFDGFYFTNELCQQQPLH
jgi:hypothetical protein